MFFRKNFQVLTIFILELVRISFDPASIADKAPVNNLQKTGTNAASINRATAVK